MSSNKDDDKTPRDTDDDRLSALHQNEAQSINPPMEGNPSTRNIQITESISRQPTPIRSTRLLTPRPPRTISFAPGQVQNWLKNVIDHLSASVATEDTPTLTTDISDFTQILSLDSLTDQQYTPLRLPFATRSFPESLSSNVLIPDVPKFSPMIMATLRNPMQSRPRAPSTPGTRGQPEQGELLFRPHRRTISPNRSELMTDTYSNILPNQSRITAPRQTTQTLCTSSSRSLTPGRFISLSRSSTSISTPRIISSAPYQRRIITITRPSTARSAASSSVINPIPRPMAPPRYVSTRRVVLHPRRRLGFSASADIIEPASTAPLTHSISEPTAETAPLRSLSRNVPLSPDLVPTRVEATTLQPIVLPITEAPPPETPVVPLTDNYTEETLTLLPKRDLPIKAANTIYERKETAEASSLNQQVPAAEIPILLNPRAPITQPAILLNPRFSVTQSPKEAPLTREVRSAVQEVTRIITITNPKTKEVQEYWVRRNQEMLPEVAGSINDAAASSRAPKRGPVKTVLVKKVIRLVQPSKKKNLKGIKRKPSNPIKSQSSSSGESPHQKVGPPPYDLTKYNSPKVPKYQQKEATHIRTKRPKKCDNSVSSGYPVWKDDISKTWSSSGSKLCALDEFESPRPDCPEMTLEEKIESYFADIRRHGRQQNDDDSN